MGLLDDIIGGVQKNALVPLGTAVRNTINNGVVNPSIRNIELLNPNSDTRKGLNLTKQSAQQYGYTPSFLDTVIKAYPTVQANKKLDVDGALNGHGADAAAYSTTGEPNNIVINDNGVSNLPQNLLHEGLHQEYQKLTPQQIQSFNQAADSALAAQPDVHNQGNVTYRQGLGSYLRDMLGNYSGSTGSIGRVEDLPANLQNEVHSYIPEYYQNQKLPYDSQIGQYYANYFNTGQKATPVQKKGQAQSFFDTLFAPTRK